jgi:hypothetical protein
LRTAQKRRGKAGRHTARTYPINLPFLKAAYSSLRRGPTRRSVNTGDFDI